MPVLQAHKLECGGKGLLFPPARPGCISGTARKPALFMRSNGLHAALQKALTDLGLAQEGLGWYQATRSSREWAESASSPASQGNQLQS